MLARRLRDFKLIFSSRRAALIALEVVAVLFKLHPINFATASFNDVVPSYSPPPVTSHGDGLSVNLLPYTVINVVTRLLSFIIAVKINYQSVKIVSQGY